MPVDPKPAGAVRDPELLRKIHDAYNAYGCAICGRTASPDAPSGFQIEVHHHPDRRRGNDSWEDCVGLCGELAGCKGHRMVESGNWLLSRIDGSLWLVRQSEPPRRLEQLNA